MWPFFRLYIYIYLIQAYHPHQLRRESLDTFSPSPQNSHTTIIPLFLIILIIKIMVPSYSVFKSMIREMMGGYWSHWSQVQDHGTKLLNFKSVMKKRSLKMDRFKGWQRLNVHFPRLFVAHTQRCTLDVQVPHGLTPRNHVFVFSCTNWACVKLARPKSSHPPEPGINKSIPKTSPLTLIKPFLKLSTVHSQVPSWWSYTLPLTWSRCISSTTSMSPCLLQSHWSLTWQKTQKKKKTVRLMMMFMIIEDNNYKKEKKEEPIVKHDNHT